MEHVPLPWCRHLGPTCSGPHQTRKCCACGANLGHQAWLDYWAEVDERDEEQPRVSERDDWRTLGLEPQGSASAWI